MNILRFAPRYSDTGGVVGRFCARSLRVPAAVELVYLPFVMFRYFLETSGRTGKRKAASGFFLADLIQGTPMNVRANTIFLEEGGGGGALASFLPVSDAADGKGEKAIRVGRQEVAADQILPALLDMEEAISRGRRLLRYDLMRLAGGLRYRNWEVVIHPDRTVIYYPFWLIYYRNRRGEMCLSAIDGLNGRRESGEIATSLKKGLLEKEDEKKEIHTRA